MKIFWTIETFSDELILPDFAKYSYKEVLPYITNFLCSPHPFRKGSLCPFVPSAVKYDRIFFTFFDEEITIEKSKEFIKECIDFYFNTNKNKRIFGAIIILFPENFNIENLLKIHFLNKEQCVVKSLMLGALYKNNQAQSLHNSDYYPLRTPTPIIVIRDMVPSDIIFLDPKLYNIKKRLKFIEVYINKFQPIVRDEISKNQINEAIKIRNLYKRKLLFSNIMKLLLIVIIIIIFSLFYIKK